MTPSFEAYVAGRSPALLRFAYLLVGDPVLAEDILQDTLVKVHRHWRRVRQADSPDHYVRRMLVNEANNWRRRASVRLAAAAPQAFEAQVPGPESGHAERALMWRWLGALPNKQRAVLVLRYYEDLPDDAIGDILNCSPSTVRSQASRALAALRQRHQTRQAFEEAR